MPENSQIKKPASIEVPEQRKGIMRIPRLYSLQSKFILGLIFIIMIISVINITGLWFFMQKTLQDEVSTRAEIVLDQVDSVKKYVQLSLRPKMFEEVPDKFIREAMSSSFITRSVMEQNHSASLNYIFRRVAIGARNPEFEANKVEKELVQYFRDNQDQELWTGTKKIREQDVYIMARPVRYGQSCLLCHGDPADSPKELADLYPDSGFYHTLDSIDGIDLVGIPTKEYAAKNDSEFLLYVVIYLTISCLVLFLIYQAFQRVVIVNLRTLTSQFRNSFKDQKGSELLKKVEHGDEVEEMIEAMEGLGQHLYETDKQLKSHTANLEAEVARRTEQLSLENLRRRRDFELFVDILRSLKASQKQSDLWQSVLPVLTRTLGLQSASYICTFSSNRSYSWPPGAMAPALPANHVDLLTRPRIVAQYNTVFIPIGSSDDNIEGLLYLQRPPGKSFSDDEVEMFNAVGRQLGIAAENLAALDSVLRQTNNLQAIFEGITDPLMLIEHPGAIIMANDAANNLLESLAFNDRKQTITQCLVSLGGKEVSELLPEDPPYSSKSKEITIDGGRSFLLSTFPLIPAGDQPPRLILSIQENTEHKRVLQQMVQSEKMATVGELAAGLAHELNNPLGVILCYAELLKKSVSDPELQEDINVVLKHTQQAQAVLLDLLNFARPKVSMSSHTVIGDITEGVTNVFKVKAAKENVTLRCHRSDAHRRVLVEPSVIEHIVLNLLLNALDAVSEANGTIDVYIDYLKETNVVQLRVEDSGTGIDPAIHPYIFDPFFTTKDVNKGTGLGLAIIYRSMEELGGTIEARSLPKGGAVFELNFPASDS